MTAEAASQWRGIATEQADDVSAPVAALLRRRSRRLLADLLRPYRRGVSWTAAAIVVASLAALAGPWLVGIAIDNGVPPVVRAGNPVPLLRIAALFTGTVIVQAVATRMFVTMTGRVGQSVVLELRRRLFRHLLRLPVAFHESRPGGLVGVVEGDQVLVVDGEVPFSFGCLVHHVQPGLSPRQRGHVAA
ncbi:MAG TPA: ABC transporter transmembrane domain-containing protein, partial [Streptosporangiaceae bacterium]|nr:ABC transporter transmembrane domain-containing protein [Streptosporangiaceae bacterium]